MAKVTDNIVDGLNKAFSNVKFADTTEKMKTLSQMKNSIEEDDAETTEATGSGSSGQYSGPLFSEPVKNTLFQPGTEMNVKTKPKGGFVKKEKIGSKKVEATEATGASSAGQYSQPAFLAANSKNWGPSKNTQIPGGKFVKVKEKCKRFPYCNQGDINSIEMWESKMVQDALSNVSKNTGLSQDYIKSLVESQLNKKDYRKIVKEEEPEFVFLDRGEPSKKTSFEDLIQDKKAKFLIDKFMGKEFQFNDGKLSGKFEIVSIGPADKYIGFASSLENYNFENGEDVQIIIDLKELNLKGEKVPVGFYDMISRYLPEEDEEDSYRGDPVESAVMSGLDDLDETLKYLSLYLAKVRINPYSNLRR